MSTRLESRAVSAPRLVADAQALAIELTWEGSTLVDGKPEAGMPAPWCASAGGAGWGNGMDSREVFESRHGKWFSSKSTSDEVTILPWSGSQVRYAPGIDAQRPRLIPTYERESMAVFC